MKYIKWNYRGYGAYLSIVSEVKLEMLKSVSVDDVSYIFEGFEMETGNMFKTGTTVANMVWAINNLAERLREKNCVEQFVSSVKEVRGSIVERWPKTYKRTFFYIGKKLGVDFFS